jgi:hypothetical protein
MTDKLAQRCSEMEANALGALKKGNKDAAAECLTKAIGLTPYDHPATRLTRALALVEVNPGKAICTLDGHDYSGGPTCYHCGRKR